MKKSGIKTLCIATGLLGESFVAYRCHRKSSCTADPSGDRAIDCGSSHLPHVSSNRLHAHQGGTVYHPCLCVLVPILSPRLLCGDKHLSLFNNLPTPAPPSPTLSSPSLTRSEQRCSPSSSLPTLSLATAQQQSHGQVQ